MKPLSMYVVQGRIVRKSDDGEWETVRELPTFYLDPRVQGITNRVQAMKIAREILGPDALFNIHLIDVPPVKEN